jgi:methylenetetrahydrofolate reductase (NADPH)
MQWSKLYGTGTPSQKLIAEIMETYTLVNVVHNDFRTPEAIFAPFYRAAESTPPSTNGLSNGHHSINGHGINGHGINGVKKAHPITNGLTNGHA